MVSVPATQATTQDWRASLRPALIAADVIAALGSAAVAHMVRFGTYEAQLHIGTTQIDYRFIPLLSAVAWVGLLAAGGAYDGGSLGVAADAQRKVRRAGIHLLSVTAVLTYVANVSPPRGYVLLALPLTVVGSSMARWLLHRRLGERRRRGNDCDAVILIGPAAASDRMLEHLARHPTVGFQVVGILVPADDPGPAGGIAPVLGIPDDAAAVATSVGARLAIVTGSGGATGVQELAWALADVGCDLAIAPEASEIAGPQLEVRHDTDLPLLRLSNPHLSRASSLFKAVTDRTFAVVALLLLSPILLAIAAAIRSTSAGPALFRQERFGLGGRRFSMVKFRTMVDGAEALQDAAMDAGARNGTIFKQADDPRITRVGRILRRLSLDELPQLVNVARGEMSLVGPRPRPVIDIELHLASRGELDQREERRMLVKPGMTGLWQVSGRNDLPFEEAMRLDMYYIDHWSPQLDLIILWRTVAAVVRGRGAY